MEKELPNDSMSPSQQKKVNKSFKDLVQDFADYTTAHGIGRLGASQTLFGKIFWSLCCLGAFFMFGFQATGLFQQYLSNPVATSVSVTFEKRLSFPAVTICNLNMLRYIMVPKEVMNLLEENLQYSGSETEDSEARRRRRNSPTSDSPGTGTSITVNPSTNDPTSDISVTNAPSTNNPTSNSGTTHSPSTNTPTTDISTADSATTNAPTSTGEPTAEIGSTVGTTDFSTTDYPSTESTDTQYQNSDLPTTDYNYDHDDDQYNDHGYNDHGYNDHGYNDYGYDDYGYNDYGYDDYDYDYDYDGEGGGDFPDANSITLETRLRIKIDQMIGGMDPKTLAESGHQFEDLVVNCTWKGVDCKAGNLSKFWSRQWNYKYGNCYTFNGGPEEDEEPLPVLTATKAGPSHGLVLELNVEQHEYVGPLTDQAGVRVLLHGQGSMIFPFEEGFSASPGVSTSIGIKKTQITRLDRFNNKSCLPVDELPTSNIYRRYENITTYSQQACFHSCLGLSQRERCKCSEAAYPSDRPPCDIFDTKTKKCLKAVKYLFNHDKLECLEDCRQPCREEIIQKTISSSEWPSIAYRKYLESQKQWDDDSDNLLKLNVFFNELNYERIEESFSYGTINLLADIGGQLGLWIGLSVITVCELLELIVMFFALCLKKISARKKVHDGRVQGW